MSGKKKFNNIICNGEYSIMLVKHKDAVLEVLIDNEDAEKVRNIGSWHGIYDNTLQTPNYYICHRNINSPCIKLHRFIMNCPKDKVIDHINHNTLDNRKQNLKICSHFENQQNLRSKSTNQTGVYQRKRGNWCASISKNNKRYTKEFKTKEQAILWRKQMETLLYKGVMP